MLFLSGATIPRQILPAAVRKFSTLLPLTHVVTLLRGLWAGGSWNHYHTEVLVLVGMLALGALLSARLFRRE